MFRQTFYDKNPLDIKFSPVDKRNDLVASGKIKLHGCTNNDADASQGQADGLFNQTMVECKKKNTILN